MDTDAVKMSSLSEEDFSCPICREVFKDPVILSCSHSFCRECLQQFWRTKSTQQCAICRRLSAHEPLCNLVLKNVCESFFKDRKEGSEEICSLHHKKLKLFCLEDKHPVCLVCITSHHHDQHTFRPIGELVQAYKDIDTAMKFLQGRLRQYKNSKEEFEKALEHIKAQSTHTEIQISLQFFALRQFLFDEEKAMITALKEEEEQKKQMMRRKLKEINARIYETSHTMKRTEEMLKDNVICFIKDFLVSMERFQSLFPDPQTPSGALINVSQYLGNLKYRVWRKMQDVVHYTPVILDPNTAHPHLILSDDLTSVRESKGKDEFPNNPERFDRFPCVLGSEGFRSGKHSWVVEVSYGFYWNLGVTTASNRRKGRDFYDTDVWSVEYYENPPQDSLNSSVSTCFTVTQKLECVRVELDCDEGTVCFSDPVTNTHLHTFTATFTDTVFPFFWGFCYQKILPINKQ